MDSGGEIAAYLRRRIPELLGLSVEGVSALAAGVWRVRVVDGRELVAKYQIFAPLTRGKAYDLLEVERDVLAVLSQAHCPVPRLLVIDVEAFLAIFESVGSETLDDWVHEQRGATEALVEQIICGQCAIDTALAQRTDSLAPRVAPGADGEALVEAWDEVGQRAQWGLEALRRHLHLAPPTREVQSALGVVHAYLAQRQPALGSSDYNARNIVVSAAGPTASFIEFAKLGWDWTERRLVQYTTCMGSGRPGAVMRPLLDARAARRYAEISLRPDAARALDGHHIFFMLNGAAALCRALEQPKMERSKALLGAWDKPAKRLRQFTDALAKPLSDDADAARLRAAFRDT